MIMVLLNWLYIAFTSFITGYAVLGFFSGLFNAKINRITSYIWAGLVFVNVYAQFFSLVGGVGLAANIVLLALCAGIVIFRRRDLGEYLKNQISSIRSMRIMKYVYLGIIILMSYGTSRGFLHYDTSLYHAQSIRWIEEYGVVPGLASLQLRIGYNSAEFALNALYSMKWLIGQSLHTTAGFFALLGAFQVSEIYRIFTEKRVIHSDFIRLGLLFYLGLIYTEMLSPASDYYAQILIFVVVIMWLDAGDEDIFTYASLSILLVYATSVKFSIALLVLLVIRPAYMMIKQKQIKQIIVSLLMGIIILLPFFIRNIIISGWLIYPSTFIDIANVDWKIPKGMAQYDAAEIGVYGKGINDVALKNMPMNQWMPGWFAGMTIVEKFWVLIAAASIVAGIIYFICKIIKGTVDNKKLLLFAVVVASGFVWFFTAPLVRYGYGYLTCIPLFVDGCLCLDFVNKTNDMKSLRLAYIIVLAIIGVYRIKTVGYQIVTTLTQPYYFAQKDYTDWPASEYNLNNIVLYVPEVADQIGYEKFPSAMMVLEVEMRGDDIRDGFRFSDYEGWIQDYLNK